MLKAAQLPITCPGGPGWGFLFPCQTLQIVHRFARGKISSGFLPSRSLPAAVGMAFYCNPSSPSPRHRPQEDELFYRELQRCAATAAGGRCWAGNKLVQEVSRKAEDRQGPGYVPLLPHEHLGFSAQVPTLSNSPRARTKKESSNKPEHNQLLLAAFFF